MCVVLLAKNRELLKIMDFIVEKALDLIFFLENHTIKIRTTVQKIFTERTIALIYLKINKFSKL